MDRIGDQHNQMWDPEDGFFYDVLRLPNGDAMPAKGSLDGWVTASVRIDGVRARARGGTSRMMESVELFRKRHPDVVKHIAPLDGKFIGCGQRRLLSVCNKENIESDQKNQGRRRRRPRR